MATTATTTTATNLAAPAPAPAGPAPATASATSTTATDAPPATATAMAHPWIARPLEYPSMRDAGMSLTTLPSATPPRFPRLAEYHRAHASLRLALSVPLSRVKSVHVYAVGCLIIDGRKFRVQGWLARLSTFSYHDAAVQIHVDEPVLLVSRLQSRSERDLDYLEGEFHVGRLALLSTGAWRLYGVVQQHSGAIAASPPTPRLNVRVDDDWELVDDACVSLAALVDKYNPHQVNGDAGAGMPAVAAAAAAPGSLVDPVPLAARCPDAGEIEVLHHHGRRPSSRSASSSSSTRHPSRCPTAASGKHGLVSLTTTPGAAGAKSCTASDLVAATAHALIEASDPAAAGLAMDQPRRYLDLASRFESKVPIFHEIPDEW
ncbi:hypothetical protein H9P43_004054 [Blastocladiella emersonii ATCC 22665]|nr:hypothetical protein H9P43_004054 [Blastocladiella emersonii ATCC 22665]